MLRCPTASCTSKKLNQGDRVSQESCSRDVWARYMMSFLFQVACVAAVLCLLFVLLVAWYRSSLPASAQPHVAVIVLGDIGRSPRMQYHATSLAKHGCEVSLIGYAGVLSLFLGLLRLLLSGPRFDVLLVQNPPAVPTLVIARLIATLQAASLIIDFHNFGYSLLALKLGETHLLVQAHLLYERVFGRMADDAFCVTVQMQSRLADRWHVRATPLHDRPAAMFRPTALQEQHVLFQKLWKEGLLDALSEWWPKDECETLFTQLLQGETSRSSCRPHLIISSTSWTPDEDFGQLLEALPAFNRDLAKAAKRAVVVVTGKGELRQQFEERYAAMLHQLDAVRVLTLWLSFADYALLLGSADLGLSLHTSSSGDDLPMKVVDMFGAGLPVCARSFTALPELVQHGENGFAFTSSEELSRSLSHALGVATYNLPQLKSTAGERKLNGWDENWDKIAWPLIQSHLHPSRRKDQ
eukprot:s304_g42.t2